MNIQPASFPVMLMPLLDQVRSDRHATPRARLLLPP
jgi:hypothetical protein